MRQEQEMMQAICDFAKENDQIRAVMMNGSRANPTVKRDIFQDYDIVYFVGSVQGFVDDPSWISYFGDIMIMQTPDRIDHPDQEQFTKFTYLMQFMDGNRIDLTFYQIDQLEHYAHDSQTLILLDKDGILGEFPPSSNRDYLTVPPSSTEFFNCCNEFWWISTYVAKGLWRRQLPYSMRMYEVWMRNMLLRMLSWRVGILTDFEKEFGKEGKYLEQYLESPKWDAFVRTFANGDYEHIWQALFEMCDLFRDVAHSVADHFGYEYPEDDDRRVTAYLHHIYNLPLDAKGIY